jgi:hypothetical protein
MDIIVQVLEGSRKVTTETAAVSHDATFMELLEMVTDGCNYSLLNRSVTKVELTEFHAGSAATNKPLVVKTQPTNKVAIMHRYGFDFAIFSLEDITPKVPCGSAFSTLMGASQIEGVLKLPANKIEINDDKKYVHLCCCGVMKRIQCCLHLYCHGGCML